jgi:ferredoxin
MKRKIVSINEEKCNGCGLCVNACHEGAITLSNGKAKLISDEYCDGLGACLPECPTGAIEIIERDAAGFNEALVQKKQEANHPPETGNILACGCPGTAARTMERKETPGAKSNPADLDYSSTPAALSELRQWPVQIRLVNTKAGYLNNADLLIAADCTAYAYAGFHRDFIKGRITLIGCPKLDDNEYYREKLTEILKANSIKSITVVRMEVPCCAGIVQAVKSAMLESKVIVPYREVIVSTEGEIME